MVCHPSCLLKARLIMRIHSGLAVHSMLVPLLQDKGAKHLRYLETGILSASIAGHYFVRAVFVGCRPNQWMN